MYQPLILMIAAVSLTVPATGQRLDSFQRALGSHRGALRSRMLDASEEERQSLVEKIAVTSRSLATGMGDFVWTLDPERDRVAHHRDADKERDHAQADPPLGHVVHDAERDGRERQGEAAEHKEARTAQRMRSLGTHAVSKRIDE